MAGKVRREQQGKSRQRLAECKSLDTARSVSLVPYHDPDQVRQRLQVLQAERQELESLLLYLIQEFRVQMGPRREASLAVNRQKAQAVLYVRWRKKYSKGSAKGAGAFFDLESDSGQEFLRGLDPEQRAVCLRFEECRLQMVAAYEIRLDEIRRLTKLLEGWDSLRANVKPDTLTTA